MTGCKVVRLGFGLPGFVLAFFALPLVAAAQQGPQSSFPDAPSAVKLETTLLPAIGSQTLEQPPQENQSQHGQARDSDGNSAGFLHRGLQDQKEIYSAPFHRRNLKWDALFLLATGGLVAADRTVAGDLSHNHLALSQHISDIGLFSTMAATGALYLSGVAMNDEHARETGVLGVEALGNTLVVDAVTQVIAGRERPLEGSGHGRFLVRNTLNSAFPSQHSGLTWSMASVIAHEYPRPWVQILAYGAASTVSVTRMTGMKHFPADVAVGGVFGYLIGQHIFHAHSHHRPAERPRRRLPD